MKRIVLSLALFAFAGFSQSISPITAFNSQDFLVNGAWLADDGSQGNYVSTVYFENDGWTTAQFRVGSLYIYENVLNFDANGFFSAQVTDASDPANPAYYGGFGNCGSSQCQMSVLLNNGVLQKSMVFDYVNNEFYGFGAIYFNDGTPNVQWEESAVALP